MNKYLLSLMLALGAAGTTIPAAAVPFVSAGSSYSFYLQGENSGEPFLGVATFDGIAETTTRAGLDLTVSESETALGGGKSRITFDLRANGSLFPIADEIGIFGIGVDSDGDGFDIAKLVSLDKATIILYDINNMVVATLEDLQDLVDPTTPWDGRFAGIGNAVGIGDLDVSTIAGIGVEFLVSGPASDVPEPGSILLSGIGLLAIVAAARRRRRA